MKINYYAIRQGLYNRIKKINEKIEKLEKLKYELKQRVKECNKKIEEQGLKL